MAVIAISSETFSGGEALTKGVAEQLAYRCTSQEVLPRRRPGSSGPT